MNIHIRNGAVHLINLQTRMPFKYGIATMTQSPHAFVSVEAEIDGKVESGIAADHLPPKWFTKVPDKPIADEVLEMADVIAHGVQAAVGMRGDSAFSVWRELWNAQRDWGRQNDLPALLTHFGTSLVERALLEAVCRAADQPIAQMIANNRLGMRLGDIHSELSSSQPADFLPKQPLSQITSRHTIGMADPLVESDVPSGRQVNDGLPQSLTECIKSYGLKHFKIKVFGDIKRDVERLRQVANVLESRCGSGYAFSLDGNEQFHSSDAFAEFWKELGRHSDLKRFFEHLLFVEQPIHRDVALTPETVDWTPEGTERPMMIIDESDGDLGSLVRALELGYAGTSHKNCKGIFKGLANACLLAHRQREHPDQRYIMSGEDLANIGPVALLQDLAMCAALGITSVERNGHHYFAGLSMFPEAVQKNIFDHHSDLYRPSRDGWPTLNISDGRLALDSVNAAPFGVGFRMDTGSFATLEEWRSEYTGRTAKKG